MLKDPRKVGLLDAPKRARFRRRRGAPKSGHSVQFERLEERTVLAPVPIVTLSDPGTAMIGEDVTFNVAFENQATGAPSVGYGPYIDLFMDTTGADGIAPGSAEPVDFDGFGPITANFLSASLSVIPVTLGTSGSFVHPFATDNAGNPFSGTAPAGFAEGDTLYVIALPFGSFVDDQPISDISISTNVHPEADLGSDLQFAAIGGFRYGADALDNPSLDAPIRGAADQQSVTATVVTLLKEYSGPEDETATGPNFPRQYTISADVADGQTITDLRLIDLLPDDAAFLQVVSTSPPGAVTEQLPSVGIPTNPTDNDLVVRFPSVLGTASSNDASVTLEFFVPEFDANVMPILPVASGDDSTSINDGRLTGEWDPNDPSDSLASIDIVDQATEPDNHTLTDKSIAIQKGVEVLVDTGAPGPTPGDTLLYTLDFQISDYFTFGDLQVEDVFSDGQRLVGSPSGPFTAPFTLSVTDRNGTVSGLFSPSTAPGTTNLYVDTTEIGNDVDPLTDGSTRLVFDVSQAMVDLGAADGVLQGGRALPQDAGAATGRITFQTVLQQQFSDSYPSGRPTLDQGDRLDNQVAIRGTVRANANPVSILGDEEDTSSAEVTIITGDILKTVYAINGALGPNSAAVDPATGELVGPAYANTFSVRPGDVVTYRIRYSLPTGDVEQFRISDFLPLPVFDVTPFSTVFVSTIDAVAPSAGTAKYGPDHTFSRIPSNTPPDVTPSVTVDSSANSITFDFGTYDDPPPEQQMLVDLLLSVAITDAPMVDGLALTNQVQGTHGTTNTFPVVDEDIVQIRLAQPELAVRKGVVSSDNPNRTFSGVAAPAGISFEAPGLNTPLSSFSGGTISSTNLGASLDADLSNVDAGDLVKFAITIENNGSSSAGAFDTRIRDILPTGFVIPGSGAGLNLEVFDGTGAPMGFTTLGTGLFDGAGGIEIDDPGPTPAVAVGSPPVIINGGGLDAFDTTSGRNIAIITYDLQVSDSVQPGQSTNLTNQATVYNYAAIEGGQDHTDPADLVDTAEVRIALPTNEKSIDATSEAHTGLIGSLERVAIGEVIRYRLVTELPEGVSPSFQMRDLLPGGLQFLDDGTATVALVSSSVGGVTSSLAALAGASVVGTNAYEPTVPVTAANGPFSRGTDPYFNLGTLTNNDRDTDAEFVIVEFNALTLNQQAASNDAGDTRSNRYRVYIGGSQLGANSNQARVRITEPSISVNKTASPTTVDAGDTVSYTVTYANATGNNRTTAFEVVLSDTLPADLTFVPGSLMITSTGGATGIVDATAGTGVGVNVSQMPTGSTVTLQYDATVGDLVVPAEVVNNSATVRYTSLPGPLGTVSNPTGSATPGASGSNTGERDGSAVGANDYIQSRAAAVSVRPLEITKTQVSTSIDSANNSDVQATIGELVTYDVQIEVPEGVTPAARIVDSLDPGLAFVDVESVNSSPSLTIATPIGTGSNPSNVSVSGGGNTITFNLGDIVNLDRVDSDAETITIRYRAVVLNVPGNQDLPATTLANSAQLLWTGGNLPAVSAESVAVIEPDLRVQKLANVSQVDALDTVTFTVTIDHTGGSTTDAFDVRAVDTLPMGFSYVASSLTHISGVAPSTLMEAGGTIDATWAVLLEGQASTLQFQASVNSAAQAGSALTNRADIDWSSLAGTANGLQSVHNPNSTERTGGGGVNDYDAFDTAVVSVDIATNKSIVATSEAATTGDSVVVGEIVRYHLSVQLPEGTAPSFQIQEALPTGLVYLDDGSASLAFISNGPGIQSSTLGNGFVQSGASGAITPLSALPASAVLNGPFLDGTDPLFSLGDLTNADNDADAEFVVIEFNALVLNSASNTAGATHLNQFDVSVDGTPITPASNTVQTQLVEPLITDVTKTVMTPAGGEVDAGQAVTYSVTYSNAAGASTAFDVQLVDVLPVGLTNLANVRVFRNGTLTATGYTDASTAATLDLVVDRVDPGDQIELRYDAVVATSVLPDVTIANAVTVQYSSLPGNVGTLFNPTGSTAGAPGSAVGERTGDGGINDYRDVSGASISTPAHVISGFVYRDLNNDGTFDDGSVNGLAGVTISLSGTDHLGNPVSRSAVTDSSGRYEFADLRPGNYSVDETQPTGLLNGRDSLGTPTHGAVNPNRYDDALGTYSIAVGTPSSSSDNNNFGELPPATLSGSVFVDVNNDGLRAVENGIPLVTILLSGIDDQGNAVNRTATTDATGAYQFTGLRPGTYQVDESQPVNYVDGFETRGNVVPIAGSAGGPDTIGGISLAPGQNAVNNNFGELPPAEISGRVFADINNDGVLNGNDSGLAGIVLVLSGTDANGQSVNRTTTTDVDGNYEFTGLVGGTYEVAEPTQPNGHFDGLEARNGVLLPGSIGTDAINGILLPIGGSIGENRFAEVPVVDPHGFVYIDSNNNGSRDVGEIGIPGVPVELSGFGVDVFGNVVTPQTVFTDSDGFYRFANLAPGQYTITETQPFGFQDGQEENGTPAAQIVNNDQFVGINLTNQTDGGDYNFGELSPTAGISGSVYVDQDNDGQRDSSEIGLAGVSVTIIDENNPATRVTVVTDANGDYQFVKMFPGTYRLEESQPINFIDGIETAGPSGGTIGNDVISDITIGVGQSSSGYLFGELGVRLDLISKREFLSSTNPGVDFTGQPGSGIAAVGVPLSDPSGFVYVDTNGSGQRNEGEPGIPNVSIQLTGIGTDGSTIEQQVLTNSDGFYRFAFLPPGVYSLQEIQPVGYLDGSETIGSHGGIVGQDAFTEIVLQEGDIGVDYNFGERLPDFHSGDINDNGAVQADDLDLFCEAVRNGNSWYDLNGDSRVNEDDLLYLVVNHVGTTPGDANLDGQFNSSDLVQVFLSGGYEDQTVGNSGWGSGDWNCDAEFSSADFVLSLQFGNFVLSSRPLPSVAGALVEHGHRANTEIETQAHDQALELLSELADRTVNLPFVEENPTRKEQVFRDLEGKHTGGHSDDVLSQAVDDVMHDLLPGFGVAFE